jgi:cold shock CspA family protein
MQRGTIQKVVRLAAFPEQGVTTTDGYGIIRSVDGQDIYFVLDQVVGTSNNNNIASGMVVDFELEDGPFSRAIKVLVIEGASN